MCLPEGAKLVGWDLAQGRTRLFHSPEKVWDINQLMSCSWVWRGWARLESSVVNTSRQNTNLTTLRAAGLNVHATLARPWLLIWKSCFYRMDFDDEDGEGPSKFSRWAFTKELAKSLKTFSGERRLSHYWCLKISISTGEDLATARPKYQLLVLSTPSEN